MDFDLAELIIKQVFAISSLNSVTFTFQGGEPALRGIEFYQAFVQKVNKEKDNIKVNYVLQTNTIKLNESWYKFLKINNFLVGVLLDGIKKDHDKNRFNKKNRNI